MLGDASVMLESIEGVIVSSCGALDAALRPPQIAQTQGNVIDSTIPLLNKYLLTFATDTCWAADQVFSPCVCRTAAERRSLGIEIWTGLQNLREQRWCTNEIKR